MRIKPAEKKRLTEKIANANRELAKAEEQLRKDSEAGSQRRYLVKRAEQMREIIRECQAGLQ